MAAFPFMSQPDTAKFELIAELQKELDVYYRIIMSLTGKTVERIPIVENYSLCYLGCECNSGIHHAFTPNPKCSYICQMCGHVHIPERLSVSAVHVISPRTYGSLLHFLVWIHVFEVFRDSFCQCLEYSQMFDWMWREEEKGGFLEMIVVELLLLVRVCDIQDPIMPSLVNTIQFIMSKLIDKFVVCLKKASKHTKAHMEYMSGLIVTCIFTLHGLLMKARQYFQSRFDTVKMSDPLFPLSDLILDTLVRLMKGAIKAPMIAELIDMEQALRIVARKEQCERARRSHVQFVLTSHWLFDEYLSRVPLTSSWFIIPLMTPALEAIVSPIDEFKAVSLLISLVGLFQSAYV